MSAHTIIILAGGTGGHIFPAQSVCAHLPDQRLIWMGRAGGLEQRAAENIGAEFFEFEFCSPRKFSLAWLFVRQLLQSCRAISAQFSNVRPDLVVGFGGYYSVPGALVALWKKIPLVIHEQNRRAGLANRLLSLWAKKIITAYPEAFANRGRTVCLGNPLRAEHGGDPRPPRSWPDHNQTDSDWRILVLGGSQGAQQINSMMPQVLARLNASKQLKKNISVHHYCGRSNRAELVNAYAEIGQPAQVEEFSEEMHLQYDWADVAICRAGAMTLAELAHHALPAVVLPLASAAGNHQFLNADYYAQHGGTVVLANSDDLDARVSAALARLFANPASLSAMSAAMQRRSRPRVAATIAQLLLSCCFAKPLPL